MEPETIVKLHQLENERDACDSLCCICVELLQRLRATEYTEYPDSLLSSFYYQLKNFSKYDKDSKLYETVVDFLSNCVRHIDNKIAEL